MRKSLKAPQNLRQTRAERPTSLRPGALWIAHLHAESNNQEGTVQAGKKKAEEGRVAKGFGLGRSEDSADVGALGIGAIGSVD